MEGCSRGQDTNKSRNGIFSNFGFVCHLSQHLSLNGAYLSFSLTLVAVTRTNACGRIHRASILLRATNMHW